MLDQRPVLIGAPSGVASADAGAIAATLAARGANLAAVSDRSDLLAGADVPLAITAVPEWLSPPSPSCPASSWRWRWPRRRATIRIGRAGWPR